MKTHNLCDTCRFCNDIGICEIGNPYNEDYCSPYDEKEEDDECSDYLEIEDYDEYMDGYYDYQEKCWEQENGK